MRMTKAGCWMALCLCVACSQAPDHHGKTPLVEVEGRFLYREDLREALPAGLDKDDSARRADRYVRRWVEETLFYRKAEENIPDRENIEQRVENYRRALVVHEYRQALIAQKLADEVTEVEVEQFYRSHAEWFKVERPIVKGLFIKVPRQAPRLDDVRRWYRSDSREAVEQLEKYSLRNAVKYEYFYDRWRPADEVAAWLPREEGTRAEKRLAAGLHMEAQDSAFLYFLHVTDYRGAGGEEPYEMARAHVRELLLNGRRTAFLRQVGDDLYREALENKEIKYY